MVEIMNNLKYLAVAVCALLIMGCPARSLFPLFSEKDLSFNPDLIGTWVDKDHEEYTFQKSSDKDYTVFYLGKDGETEVFTVQLGRLGNDWFLDSYPRTKNDDYHLLPTHVISQMRLSGDTLRIASLESDYFRDTAPNGSLKSPHAFIQKDLVLTGTSAELQQLILSLADNKAAFPDTTTFIRRK